MHPALVVRFRPAGPWRIGPDSGARNRVDRIYHSDSLLFGGIRTPWRGWGGWRNGWRRPSGTRKAPAVRFSSCFPYLEDAALRGSAAEPLAASRRRRRCAGRVRGLCRWRWWRPAGERAAAEGERLARGRPEPVPAAGGMRRSATGRSVRPCARTPRVDRRTGRRRWSHDTACLEFAPGGGLWAVVAFADEEAESQWKEAVRAALRLLADTGLGGERSIGWGRSDGSGVQRGRSAGHDPAAQAIRAAGGGARRRRGRAESGS